MGDGINFNLITLPWVYKDPNPWKYEFKINCVGVCHLDLIWWHWCVLPL